MITFLEDIIAQAQDEGIINTKQSSQAYALYVFSALQGYRSTGILLKDEQQLDSIIEIVLDSLK